MAAAKRLSLPELEELQLSTAVTVEESVEFPATLSKKPSDIMASAWEKSRRSSMAKDSRFFGQRGAYPVEKIGQLLLPQNSLRRSISGLPYR